LLNFNTKVLAIQHITIRLFEEKAFRNFKQYTTPGF